MLSNGIQGWHAVQPPPPVASPETLDLLFGPAAVGQAGAEPWKVLHTLESDGQSTGFESSIGIGAQGDPMAT